MDWFKYNISQIKHPYEFREAYNKNRDMILSNESYYLCIINAARIYYNKCTHRLDREIINNFLMDIACDKEDYKPKDESDDSVLFDDDHYDPMFPVFAKQATLIHKVRDLKPSKYVRIEILSDDCEDMLDEVQNELIRIGALECESNRDLAKFLGVSDRTVRMYLSDFLKNQKKRNAHEHTS